MTPTVARIGTWQGSPEELARWIVRAREEVKPSIRQDPGLSAVYWLVDRENGTGLIVTLWESAAAMQASEEARLRRQTGTAAATGARVTTGRYEVIDALVMPGPR
jgi:heme-degrading monooxygenase HmoA